MFAVMLTTPIYITGCSSLSALGNSEEEIWKNYNNDAHFLQESEGVFGGKLGVEEPLNVLSNRYRKLDKSVLMAMTTAEQAIQQAKWLEGADFGINFGSSRGATELFERYHADFLTSQFVSPLTSPTTTLGNISSWVAQHLRAKGPVISHSITCSTAMHSLLNGIAWLQSGLCEKFLVGGSEAPLTPFTIAQMQALKIYTKRNNGYICRALDTEKTENTMVLGEGAAAICLEKTVENAQFTIEGIGFATEYLEHSTSISESGQSFQDAMKMAMKEQTKVDAIVLHAPGTIKGDLAELNAIKQVFGDNTPLLTTNKWKIGHTFGASGLLSLELALLMIKHNQFIQVPYLSNQEQTSPIKKVLVNSIGFGGNAVSILVSALD